MTRFFKRHPRLTFTHASSLTGLLKAISKNLKELGVPQESEAQVSVHRFDERNIQSKIAKVR